MTPFARIDGILHAESVPLPTLTEQLPTPFYCYSLTSFEERYRLLQRAFAAHGAKPHIAYAVKANGHLPCLAALAQLNCHADIVSIGELQRCLAANIDASRIIFSGVGKTTEDMEFALQKNIKQFNIESAEELDSLATIAHGKKTVARVALRVNPDMHAPTHDKIATARRDDKFGIAAERIPALCQLIADHAYLQWQGLAVHLGSQIFEASLYKDAIDYLLALDGSLPAPSPHFDIGGGIGCAPDKEMDIESYARLISAQIDRPFIIEPGRFIAAPSGILVSRVVRVKKAAPCHFIIVDAAMNDLLRPALYDAQHPLQSIARPRKNHTRCHVVGPICESSDVFLRDVSLPALAADDYVAFTHSGAYGAVMASCYNARPLAAEVVVQNKQWAISKKHLTVHDMLTSETIPSWMTS